MIDDEETNHSKDFKLLDDDEDNNASSFLSSSTHNNKPILNSASGNRYNISPNRPNQNSRLELKSIERPRSHSPNKQAVKKIGMEEYIEMYKTNPEAQFASQNNNNKITMNLRMDDLLATANLNKNESNYQQLSDFSFMTGDTDEQICNSRFNNNKNHNNRRRTSKKSLNDEDDEGNNGFKSYNQDGGGRDGGDDENDADEDEKEDLEETNNNLKYKYTATYRKDEATGSFQEKSKISFEQNSANSSQKPSRPPPPPPPPPRPSQPPSTLTSNNITASTPTTNTTNVNIMSDPKMGLEQILETLKKNSEKLDTKLDKIDDITASSNIYFDSTKNDNDDDDSPSTSGGGAETTAIKKKNDQFFNDILSKSDNLIAQTQTKLEKLSKLETVVKPIGPVFTSTPPPPKHRPVPTQMAPAPPPPPPSTSTTTESSLLTSVGQNIKDSKSLIDLKAENLTSSNQISSEPEDQQPQNSKIDLLFDMNDTYLIPVASIVDPVVVNKPNSESYYDLLGLNKSNSNMSLKQGGTSVVVNEGGMNPDLLKLSEETGGSGDSSRAQTPFKDDLLDSLLGEIPTLPKIQPPTSLLLTNIVTVEPPSMIPSPPSQSSSQPQPPSIDILITEPLHEKDDDNIVPDDYFNLKHEIPKYQSRPHSPSSPNNNNHQIPNSASFNNAVSADQQIKSPSSMTSSVSTGSIARPRPQKNQNNNNNNRPPSPPIRSRSASPLPRLNAPLTILEDETTNNTKTSIKIKESKQEEEEPSQKPELNLRLSKNDLDIFESQLLSLNSNLKKDHVNSKSTSNILDEFLSDGLSNNNNREHVEKIDKSKNDLTSQSNKNLSNNNNNSGTYQGFSSSTLPRKNKPKVSISQ
jgi:hypothetical protein